LTNHITVPSSPAPHLHRTLQPPDEFETTKIQETLLDAKPHLAQLDDEIAHMQMVLEDLRRKREKLHNFITAHDSFLAPVRRLSPDILADIFILCMPEWGMRSFEPDQAPLLFARVCAGWRSVVLSTQKLWSSINITLGDCLNPRLVDVWLSRAISAPLSIRLDAQYNILSSARRMWSTIALLIQYCDRWSHIELGLPSSMIRRLSSVRHRLLWLESLRIENQNQKSWPKELDIFEYAPRLRALQLESGVPRDAFKVPWSQLRELDVHYENVTECLETLQLAPNLDRCIIGCRESWFHTIDFNLSRPFPILRFPNLLILGIGDVEDPADLIDHLDLPILRDLDVEYSTDGRGEESWLSMPPFLSFLSRCSHTLRRLCITDCSYVQPILNLAECLRNTPLLSELVVHGSRGSFSPDLLGKLTRVEDALTGTQSHLVPELAVLDIIEADIELHLFGAMVHSRWRIPSNSRHPIKRLKTVRCELRMYDTPTVFDPESLSNLLKCREEGMEIWVNSLSAVDDGKDLLSCGGQSVETD
jgi:hypothetical protein